MKDDLINLIPFAGRVYTGWRISKAAYEKIAAWFKRPPPPATKERTAQAQVHLKQAKEYLDRYYALEHERDKENYLRFSAEHIKKARRLDPDAMIVADN